MEMFLFLLFLFIFSLPSAHAIYSLTVLKYFINYFCLLSAIVSSNINILDTLLLVMTSVPHTECV